MNAAFGEKSGRSVLTEKEVLAIREKYVPWKYSTTKLSKEYFVSRHNIHMIVTGKTWRHLL